jgi:hypothetical protein
MLLPVSSRDPEPKYLRFDSHEVSINGRSVNFHVTEQIGKPGSRVCMSKGDRHAEAEHRRLRWSDQVLSPECRRHANLGHDRMKRLHVWIRECPLVDP